MKVSTRTKTRDELVEDVRVLSALYLGKAAAGLGCSHIATDLHKAIDILTSNVYGQRFAYCRREHTII